MTHGAGRPAAAAQEQIRETVLTLLAARAPNATICPSEVARVAAAEAGAQDWRAVMPAVHAEVDAMAAEGQVRLSWKGAAMPVRDGPYRIGRPEAGTLPAQG